MKKMPVKTDSRRIFLQHAAALTAGTVLLPSWLKAALKPPVPRYRVAVIDLMLLKRQKLGAFALAGQIGADGIEIDMGGLGNRETFDNKLSDQVIRRQFLEAARSHRLEICSLAMTGFYAQSFAARPGYERTVGDCLDTMEEMNIKVAFLPLGVQGDLVKFPQLRPVMVTRLRRVGEMAAKRGLVIGIETALDARAELKLLRDIGSEGIKSYFNFSNAIKNGRDLHKELRILGGKNIIQIHATNADGVWLQHDPQIDLPAVKKTLDRMGWQGWLVAERSRDQREPTNVLKNFTANTAYLKSIFQK
ncbi:sugar phosphate isomerase/epimerase [Pedobacter sp. SYP-B3415]|uniref:sugar phosphate isomerase/epimerase family protein n=1 Tax=Pedobacter sp. SYP-B3415 TaxID=2496641 RepID=UPI001F10B23E|nr:sugar phosphate isomerase/epimerase family protein [Pedobacter sp. SYP-B3415]